MQNTTNENLNDVNTQNQNPAPEQRTFTQADVDRIVSERLTREREKYEADARKREMVAQSREAWRKAGYSQNDFDGLELDDNGRVSIEKVLNFAGTLQNTINELKKAQAEREKLPHFGGSMKGESFTHDPLADVFKAPR